MKDNVYLIIHEDYTYSVCFSPTHPSENAIFLTAEKNYPVVYCYKESWNTETYKLVVCHDREELTFELSRGGKYYKQICLLWDYDWRTSKNPLMYGWESARDKYLYDHNDEYMNATSYHAICDNPTVFYFWMRTHFPRLGISEGDAFRVAAYAGNTLFLGTDGELYMDRCGLIVHVDFERLVASFREQQEYEIDEMQSEIEDLYENMSLADKLIEYFEQNADEKIPF